LPSRLNAGGAKAPPQKGESATRTFTKKNDHSSQETTMLSLRMPRHPRQRITSNYRSTDPQSIEVSAHDCRNQTASRHDAQMFGARTQPRDPYAAWLKQREAEREREAHRQNPRDAWDDLRTQGFCAAGRG
jgi:hypothetical protein